MEESLIEKLKLEVDEPTKFFNTIYFEGKKVEESSLLHCLEELNKTIEGGLHKYVLKNLGRRTYFLLNGVYGKANFITDENIIEIIDCFMEKEIQGNLYELVSNRILHRPECGDFLFTSFIANLGRYAWYLGAVINAVSLNDKKNALAKITLLIENEKEAERSEGIRLLGYFNLDKNDKVSFDYITEQIKSFLSDEDEKKRANAVSSLKYQKSYFDDFEKLFQNMSIKPLEVNYQRELSGLLMVMSKDFCSEGWFLKLFNDFLENCSGDAHVINNLDLVLSEIIQHSKNNYDISKVIYSFNKRSKFLGIKYELDKVLDSSFYFLSQDSELFRELIAKYLFSEDLEENRLCRTIVSYATTHRHFGLIHFNNSFAEKLDHDDVLFLCRKILGFFHNYTVLLQLITDLLEFSKGDKVENLLVGVLINDIGVKFGTPVVDFLEQIKDSSAKKNSLEKIIQKVSSYFDDTKKLELCNEVLPPQKIARKLNLYMKMIYRESYKSAGKGSLASLFPSVAIKYGKGNIHNIQGQLSKTDFKSIEHSEYLPSDEVFDELESSHSKFHMRMAKRGEK